MARSAIHPGEHLAEQLQELGMRAAELSRQIRVPTNRITAILNGKRAVTGDTALRLAHFFGTSPQFWLNLQTLYELRIAEQKAGKAIDKLPTPTNQGVVGSNPAGRATFQSLSPSKPGPRRLCGTFAGPSVHSLSRSPPAGWCGCRFDQVRGWQVR